MTQNYINNKTWFWLFVSLLVPYIYGLFVPLMNEDASHHADIAMHMYLNHDYVRLIDRGMNYLDKPHLHFWLAALSYNIFGVNTIAYKLPSLLLTILGFYSTFRLGKLLYNQQTGLLAALMYASAQAQFLANNDVRMDAILTASIVFATWQLVEAAYFTRWYNYVLAALGLAMAFTTKGMIGFVMPCVALFFLLLYQRNWKRMFDWRWLVVLLLWAVFISPCVYCYYLQYDLHPEAMARGMNHISGVRFILWSQNFERLEGSKWGKGHKDYFFFFHTALWAFLPWCLLTYVAFFTKIGFFIKTRFARIKGAELLTVGTIIIIFAIISSSGYQLPHYLNILFPFFALLTAGQVMYVQEHRQERTLRSYLYVQYFVAAVIFIIVAVVDAWCFPVHSPIVALLSLLFLGAAFYVVFKERSLLVRMVAASTFIIAMANVLLNGNAYPQLLNYQAGVGLAQVANRNHIPRNELYNYYFHSTTFDFYTRNLAPTLVNEDITRKLNQGETVWLLTSEVGKAGLLRDGFKIATAYRDLDYGITRLTPKFLNPATRYKVVEWNYLIKVSK
ncbi:hypothetical protein GCM10027037_28180 [Mucilaginibacter koreensis]